MCVGTVESCEKSGNLRGISVKRRRVLSIHIGCVSCGQTGLGSLCLTERGGVPRMCVGEVESCEKSGNF